MGGLNESGNSRGKAAAPHPQVQPEVHTHTGVLIYVHMPGHTDQHSQPRSVLTQTAPTALFYSPLCLIMVMLGGNAHPMEDPFSSRAHPPTLPARTSPCSCSLRPGAGTDLLTWRLITTDHSLTHPPLLQLLALLVQLWSHSTCWYLRTLRFLQLLAHGPTHVADTCISIHVCTHEVESQDKSWNWLRKSTGNII